MRRAHSTSLRDQGLAITGFLAPANRYSGTISGNRDSLTALLQATQATPGARRHSPRSSRSYDGHQRPWLPSINMLKAAKGPTAAHRPGAGIHRADPALARSTLASCSVPLTRPHATHRRDRLGLCPELDLGPLAQRHLLLANTALLMLTIPLAAWIANRIAGGHRPYRGTRPCGQCDGRRSHVDAGPGRHRRRTPGELERLQQHGPRSRRCITTYSRASTARPRQLSPPTTDVLTADYQSPSVQQATSGPSPFPGAAAAATSTYCALSTWTSSRSSMTPVAMPPGTNFSAALQPAAAGA